MMRYSVYIPNSIRKSLKEIPLPWRERIGKAIDELQKNPFLGEKMWGKLSDKRKIRVWPYRLIYELDKEKKFIVVVEVGHRGSMKYK